MDAGFPEKGEQLSSAKASPQKEVTGESCQPTGFPEAGVSGGTGQQPPQHNRATRMPAARPDSAM